MMHFFSSRHVAASPWASRYGATKEETTKATNDWRRFREVHQEGDEDDDDHDEMEVDDHDNQDGHDEPAASVEDPAKHTKTGRLRQD